LWLFWKKKSKAKISFSALTFKALSGIPMSTKVILSNKINNEVQRGLNSGKEQSLIVL
jgi:hypothetical protein